MSKWSVRVLPTVKDYAARHGKAPVGLSFSLAALLNFYRGRMVKAGEYEGQRQDGAYPIRDNPEVLAIFNAAWRQADDLERVVTHLLSDTRLWGEDLTGVSGLAEQTAAALARIKALGVKPAMAEL